MGSGVTKFAGYTAEEITSAGLVVGQVGSATNIHTMRENLAISAGCILLHRVPMKVRDGDVRRFKWKLAEVSAVDPDHLKVKVHYVESNSKSEQWYSLNGDGWKEFAPVYLIKDPQKQNGAPLDNDQEDSAKQFLFASRVNTPVGAMTKRTIKLDTATNSTYCNTFSMVSNSEKVGAQEFFFDPNHCPPIPPKSTSEKTGRIRPHPSQKHTNNDIINVLVEDEETKEANEQALSASQTMRKSKTILRDLHECGLAH
jgi:hypothetical protein